MQIENKVIKKIESRLKDIGTEFWPCVSCQKCFKSFDFVFKHFQKKHVSEKDKIKKNIRRKIIFKNYTMDDKKILIFNDSKSANGSLNQKPSLMQPFLVEDLQFDLVRGMYTVYLYVYIGS